MSEDQLHYGVVKTAIIGVLLLIGVLVITHNAQYYGAFVKCIEAGKTPIEIPVPGVRGTNLTCMEHAPSMVR